MQISRRNFLTVAGLAIASTTVDTSLVSAREQNPTAPGLQDWADVRNQFDLSREFIHMSSFFIASHPRPVREAIEKYRKEIDRNPFQVVEHGLFDPEGESMTEKVKQAAAQYIGAKSEEIALTGNTTTGLSLIYHGLTLKNGQEILTTTHDHYSHHESIRLAAARSGASIKKIALFDKHDSISEASIVSRIRNAVSDKTRAVGITWVHSSSGLKLPIRKIADAIGEFNQNRDEADRVLLIVDGVHGFGVENETMHSLGMDFFATGTHKWIFGPRGTGILWGKNANWARMQPTIPTFDGFEPFEAWMDGNPPSSPARASWISPGGFHAYEHQWALADAFRFHMKIGKQKVADRIHELNTLCKEGLASIRGIKIHTPMDPRLSAGIICLDVEGKTAQQVVEYLLARKIVASTSPYATPYARLAPSLVNSEQEVEKTVDALRSFAKS